MALPSIVEAKAIREGKKIDKKKTKTKKQEIEKISPSQKKKDVQNFLDFFNKKEGTYVEKFSDMDSNEYRRTGNYMFDHVICKYGMKFPGKMLIYGKPHIGKTSFYHAILSSYMDRNPEAYVGYLDLDRVVDHEYVEDTHNIKGCKSEKFIYMKVESAEKAMQIFSKALKDKIFDIIVLDPWNNIALEKDVKKDSLSANTQLLGKTKIADRAMINGEFFRTQGGLIEESGVSLLFSEHETSNMNTGTGFAGGNALESSMDLALQLKNPFKPPVPKWWDEKDGAMVTPVQFFVYRQKINNNKHKSYYLYYHHKKGYLSEYDKFSFLNFHGKLKQSGSYWSFDDEDLCHIKSFYFKNWESVVEEHYDEIVKLCESLVPKQKNRK